MLKTGCILNARTASDGLRISVMSRHTLSDGRAPDIRIPLSDLDDHWPLLGPSPRLIGDYYKRQLPWSDFEKRYLLQLQRAESQELLVKVISLASESTIMLLCIEEEPTCCHRRLLAQMCQKIDPSLEIAIG